VIEFVNLDHDLGVPPSPSSKTKAFVARKSHPKGNFPYWKNPG
jgi:hypothetical protein